MSFLLLEVKYKTGQPLFFLKLHYRFILFFVSLFFRQSKTLSCYVICERSLWEKEKKKNEAEFVEEHKREY